MADTKAKITLNGDDAIELDVLKGTLGQDVIDIRSLGSKGMFTFDPGFTSTASCESKITYIDGDEGILLHRGFPIDQLATESNYLEVCYILLNGEKPTQEQYDEFKTTVTRHTMIHEQIIPSAVQNANHGCDVLQILHRTAVCLSTQRPLLRR